MAFCGTCSHKNTDNRNHSKKKDCVSNAVQPASDTVTKQKMQPTSEAEDEGGFSSGRLCRWRVTETKHVHKNYEQQQTLIQNGEKNTQVITNSNKSHFHTFQETALI